MKFKIDLKLFNRKAWYIQFLMQLSDVFRHFHQFEVAKAAEGDNLRNIQNSFGLNLNILGLLRFKNPGLLPVVPQYRPNFRITFGTFDNKVVHKYVCSWNKNVSFYSFVHDPPKNYLCIKFINLTKWNV